MGIILILISILYGEIFMTKIVPYIEAFQKIGMISEDRVLYQVEQDGQMRKFSIPTEKEALFDEVIFEMKEDLKQKCVKSDTKKAQNITFISAVIGGGLGCFFAKDKKMMTKFCSTVFTALAGVLLGLGLFFKPTIGKIKNLTALLKCFEGKEYKG